MLRNFKRKSQSAVEFLLILSFIITLISGLIYFIGIMSINMNTEKHNRDIDKFANNILSQINLMQKVEAGFYREVEIPFHIQKRYNLSIQNSSTVSFLIFYDNTWNPDSIEPYIYEFPNRYIVNITTKGGGDYIIMQKPFSLNRNDSLQI